MLIPPELRGNWLVEDEKEASFIVGEETIRARYRSGEVSMSIKRLVSDEKRIDLHNVTVLHRPVVWDLRRMMQGIHYFHAVNKEGVRLTYLHVEKDMLICEWFIIPGLQGMVRLHRGFDDNCLGGH